MMTSVARAMSSYLTEKFQALDTSRFIEQGCPRDLIAKLIGASEHEICYTPNTSYGINVAANSLSLVSGRNVVLWELEFPGNLYPWLSQRSRGVEVRWVKHHDGQLVQSDLERAVDDKTAIVPISHVNWITGFRANLREFSELVHRKGGLLFVDATQSAGAIQIDVRRMEIDILACAFYKWLLGPSGAGFLYVREDLIEKLEPPFFGWNAVRNTGPPSYIFNPREILLQDKAKRYLPGSLSPIPFLGAGVSLKMLLDVGIDVIERRILDLTERLVNELDRLPGKIITPRERSSRGGIVNFSIPNAVEVSDRLRGRKIRVSARSQAEIGGIRISPHFYNTEGEISKFVNEIRRVVSTPI